MPHKHDYVDFLFSNLVYFNEMRDQNESKKPSYILLLFFFFFNITLKQNLCPLLLLLLLFFFFNITLKQNLCPLLLLLHLHIFTSIYVSNRFLGLQIRENLGLLSFGAFHCCYLCFTDMFIRNMNSCMHCLEEKCCSLF